MNSLDGLPSAIDVEKFAEARAFEINAMHEAMKNASSASTTRAWQLLPRHLRRRAASHDVRRVPLRLREKARAEMDPVRKKALGRTISKLGKTKCLTRKQSFLNRQRDKVWLETHLWHAKRMKMEDMWGYRLAVHPTEKAFRPSHRASVHGSIIHDASYLGLIEIKGQEEAVKAVLLSCTDPQGPGAGSARYTNGARVLETHIYALGKYPFEYITPITIIWMPIRADQTEKSSKAKGKEKAQESTDGQPTSKERLVWVQMHPATFDEVYKTLQAATSTILDSLNGSNPEVVVEIADMRDKINMFEIMGPKANQVLKGALKPIPQEKRGEFRTFWKAFGNLQTSGSLPRGMIIGATVVDPRLDFPPKNATAKSPQGTYLTSMLTILPSASIAQSAIWEESVRKSLANPQYTKKELDERRSKNLVPGTKLAPQRKDDRIPILLIQHSLESPNESSTEVIHGWKLIIPSGWAMAFFNSLIFTGTRVGGQRERQTQAFEAGTAYFPRDFPATEAYDVYASTLEEEDVKEWRRKPPAKRVNYEKLGVRSPWKPDWEVVLGLKGAVFWKDTEESGKEADSPREENAQNDLVPTQRELGVEVEEETSPLEPWLLRGFDVPSILATMSQRLNAAQGLLDHINGLRVKRGLDLLPPEVGADDLLRSALIQVKVKVCARGSPEDLAAIYMLSDEEVREWTRALSRHGTEIMDGSEEGNQEAAPSPDQSSNIIGYVTTGHYSLSRGIGFAIGVVSLSRFLELQEQAYRLFPNDQKHAHFLVKFRNRDSLHYRKAYIEVLSS
ncbi:hypothetical protein AX16_005369 [Volvariella volvacea WC 439]|nr:hypothetical protein AX16_005369 [Volvariella volvacea WC 439]